MAPSLSRGKLFRSAYDAGTPSHAVWRGRRGCPGHGSHPPSMTASPAAGLTWPALRRVGTPQRRQVHEDCPGHIAGESVCPWQRGGPGQPRRPSCITQFRPRRAGPSGDAVRAPGRAVGGPAAPAGPGPDRGPGAGRARRSRCRWTPPRCTRPSSAGTWRGRWEREAPDIIHAHFWTGGLAALAGAQGLGVPVVQTFLSLAAAQPALARAAAMGQRLRLEQVIARSVRAVLASSSSEMTALARLGVPRGSVTLIPRGVDAARFTPEGPVAQRGRPAPAAVRGPAGRPARAGRRGARAGRDPRGRAGHRGRPRAQQAPRGPRLPGPDPAGRRGRGGRPRDLPRPGARR